MQSSKPTTITRGQLVGPQQVSRPSRRGFLTSATAAAALAGVGGVILGSGASVARADIDPKPRGQRDRFESIQQHENDHVKFLKEALGSHARPKPTFQHLTQSDFASFAKVSQALENTGVGAYLGAAPFLDSMDYLAAAGSIALIEARHAGYLNTLRGDPITGDAQDDDSDNSFEEDLSDDEVRALAGGFIKSLNGGPPVAYDEIVSPHNDLKILNFALALEYLEAEFYNINVPKFFPK